MLTTDQISQLRVTLEEEKQEIRRRLYEDDSYQLHESFYDSTSELSVRDNHPADIGTEVFERSKDLALREGDSIRLNEIDGALERIQNNTYGVCAHCNTEISYERMEANPAARFCVNCQEQADEREISANRPVEENFLFPGFGRTFTDDNPEDQNGYDGEDAWQDVAKYGTAATNDENAYATKPDDFWVDAEERVGYVEDVEAVALSDIEGNQIQEPQFIRNEAYRRVFAEADERYWNER